MNINDFNTKFTSSSQNFWAEEFETCVDDTFLGVLLYLHVQTQQLLKWQEKSIMHVCTKIRNHFECRFAAKFRPYFNCIDITLSHKMVNTGEKVKFKKV